MIHKPLRGKRAAGKIHVAEKSLDLRLQWGNAWSKLADQQDCEVILTSHPRKAEFFHLLPPHLSCSAWPQAPSTRSSCLVQEGCSRINTEAKKSSISLKHFVLWMWSLQQQPIYWGDGRCALQAGCTCQVKAATECPPCSAPMIVLANDNTHNSSRAEKVKT